MAFSVLWVEIRVVLASGPPYNVCKEEIPGKCGVAYRNKN
jgi:hypothetical protein